MLIVTFFGPIIAGTLALPLYGTMFGPFTLGLIFFASPMTAVFWLGNLLGVHVLFLTWHSERDSIFGARAPKPILQTAKQLLLRAVQRA